MTARLAVVVAALALGACDYDDYVPPSSTAPYQPQTQEPWEEFDADGEAPCTTERAVRPILERHCTSCHDAERPSAGVDLVSPDVIARLAGRTSVHSGCREESVVVPGRPQEGMFMHKLLGTTEGCGEAMPPGETLPPEDLQCLATWIASQPQPPLDPQL